MRAKVLIESIRAALVERDDFRLPLAKSRDTIARYLFDAPYGAVLAAERAGTLAAPAPDSARAVDLGASLRFPAGALIAATRAALRFAASSEPRTVAPILEMEDFIAAEEFLEPLGLPYVDIDACEDGDYEQHSIALSAAAQIARAIALVVPDVTARTELRIVVTTRKGVLEAAGGAYLPLIKLLLGTRANVLIHLHVDDTDRRVAPSDLTSWKRPAVDGVYWRVTTGDGVRAWSAMAGDSPADVHVVYCDDAGLRGIDYWLAKGLSRSFKLSNIARSTLYVTEGRVAFPVLCRAMDAYKQKHSILRAPGEDLGGFHSGVIQLDELHPRTVEHLAYFVDDLPVVNCLARMMDELGAYGRSVFSEVSWNPGLVQLVKMESGLVLGLTSAGQFVKMIGRDTEPLGELMGSEDGEQLRRFFPLRSKTLTWEALDWVTRTCFAAFSEPD